MNGILIINKEKGYTSRDVVNIIGKKFNTRKVGHTGTLDPAATGVLVVCLGKALKICELLTSNDKEYIAGITLGIETDTLDMDGKILSTEIVDTSKDKIYEVVNSFNGKYMQEVPKYSAVKVNGKKLYEYAREGIDVILPKKEVNIKKIEVISDINYHDGLVSFKIKCTVSKGTYIRSLVRDIGIMLGVKAVMDSLERTRQSDFSIEEAYLLEDIQKDNYKLISILDALDNIPRMIVNEEDAFKIKNGRVIDRFVDSDIKLIMDIHGNLLALYKNSGDVARVYKMF